MAAGGLAAAGVGAGVFTSRERGDEASPRSSEPEQHSRQLKVGPAERITVVVARGQSFPATEGDLEDLARCAALPRPTGRSPLVDRVRSIQSSLGEASLKLSTSSSAATADLETDVITNKRNVVRLRRKPGREAVQVRSLLPHGLSRKLTSLHQFTLEDTPMLPEMKLTTDDMRDPAAMLTKIKSAFEIQADALRQERVNRLAAQARMESRIRRLQRNIEESDRREVVRLFWFVDPTEQACSRSDRTQLLGSAEESYSTPERPRSSVKADILSATSYHWYPKATVARRSHILPEATALQLVRSVHLAFTHLNILAPSSTTFNLLAGVARDDIDTLGGEGARLTTIRELAISLKRTSSRETDSLSLLVIQGMMEILLLLVSNARTCCKVPVLAKCNVDDLIRLPTSFVISGRGIGALPSTPYKEYE